MQSTFTSGWKAEANTEPWKTGTFLCVRCFSFTFQKQWTELGSTGWSLWRSCSNSSLVNCVILYVAFIFLKVRENAWGPFRTCSTCLLSLVFIVHCNDDVALSQVEKDIFLDHRVSTWYNWWYGCHKYNKVSFSVSLGVQTTNNKGQNRCSCV